MLPLEPGLDIGILSERLQRLIRLDTSVFEEVRADPAATLPAFFVVAVSTLLAGIGGWLWWMVQDFGDNGKVFVQSAILGSVFAVALWIAWLGIAWLILTQFFREEADWQQMLRAMGMAAAPLALSVGMFIPGIDVGVGVVSVALFFGLTTMAIQSVTPASTGRVVVANVAGFALWAIVLGLLATADTPLAPGIFLIDAASERLADISEFLG